MCEMGRPFDAKRSWHILDHVTGYQPRTIRSYSCHRLSCDNSHDSLDDDCHPARHLGGPETQHLYRQWRLGHGVYRNFDPGFLVRHHGDMTVLATPRLAPIVEIHRPAGEHTGKHCLPNPARDHDRLSSGRLRNPPDPFQHAG